jgi:hypothetical protein
MCDLIQPPDVAEEICIVPEVPNVYRYPRGRSMELVHTRPLNHVPQLDCGEIPPRRLNDTSGVNQ